MQRFRTGQEMEDWEKNKEKKPIYCNKCIYEITFYPYLNESYSKCVQVGVVTKRNAYEEWKEYGSCDVENKNNDCSAYVDKKKWVVLKFLSVVIFLCLVAYITYWVGK